MWDKLPPNRAGGSAEEPGRRKALDHSIYYQVDLISAARRFDELL